MGDWSNVEQLASLIILGGAPALLLGSPIAVLILLSARRQRILAAKATGQSPPRTSPVTTLLAFCTLLGVAVAVALLTTIAWTT